MEHFGCDAEFKLCDRRQLPGGAWIPPAFIPKVLTVDSSALSSPGGLDQTLKS
jgi:hypothetical protein